MNTEKAIEQLESLREHCNDMCRGDSDLTEIWRDDVRALTIAIDALRNVNTEEL